MESNQVLKGVIESLPAKTGSGYADTDLIQLYAKDGTPNGRIARSALMSCVKDSLGTLLNQGAADLGTSLAKIPALNSGGTLGSATVANLASVLGVGTNFNINFSGDLNNFTSPMPPTVLFAPSGTSAANLPPISRSHSFFLSVHKSYTNNDHSENNTRVWQIAVDIEDGGTWFRIKRGSGWSGWTEYSISIPSFYKNYADLGSLNTALISNDYSKIAQTGDVSNSTFQFAKLTRNQQGYAMILCINRIEASPAFLAIISGGITTTGSVSPLICKQIIKNDNTNINLSYKYVENDGLSFYAEVERGYILCKAIPLMVRFGSQDFVAKVSEIPSGTTPITITT